MKITVSLGEESHLFLRSKDRRLHYNGARGVFIIRNAGPSAGFDEDGNSSENFICDIIFYILVMKIPYYM